MKIGWLLLLSLIVSFSLGAENYKVVSGTYLEARENASLSSAIVGKLTSKDTIHVMQIDEQWALIEYNGREAYVDSKYILPLYTGGKRSAEEFFFGLLDLFSKGPFRFLPLLIFLTFSLTLFFRWVFARNKTIRLYIGVIGLAATCCMELCYFIPYNNGLPWFCDPDIVGWLWTIINFFLYGFILIRQLRLGLALIPEICDGRPYNLKIGIYSFPVAFVLMIIFYFADITMTEYIAWGLLVAQFVQVIINFYLIRHWRRALLVSLLFVLTSVAMLFSSLSFLAMLFMVVVVLLLLSLAGSVLENNSRIEYINN